MDSEFELIADEDEILSACLKIFYTLDPVQMLTCYSYFFTDISLEQLSDRYYKTNSKGQYRRVSKQSIHQYVIRPVYQRILEELEDQRMIKKINTIARKKTYSSKYLISLDMATKTTGYTVFKDDVIVDNGVIKIKPSLPIENRVSEMRKSMSTIINKHRKGFVDDILFFIVFEDFFYSPKTKNSAQSTLAMRGAAYTLLDLFPSLVYLKPISPSSWKAMYSSKQKDDICNDIIDVLVKERGLDKDYLKSLPNDALESAAIGIYAIQEDKYYNQIKIKADQ